MAILDLAEYLQTLPSGRAVLRYLRESFIWRVTDNPEVGFPRRIHTALGFLANVTSDQCSQRYVWFNRLRNRCYRPRSLNPHILRRKVLAVIKVAPVVRLRLLCGMQKASGVPAVHSPVDSIVCDSPEQLVNIPDLQHDATSTGKRMCANRNSTEGIGRYCIATDSLNLRRRCLTMTCPR